MTLQLESEIGALKLVALLVPVAIVAIGIARATGEIYTRRDATASPVPVDIAARTYDPGKPTAVLVLGSEGANVADLLAEYHPALVPTPPRRYRCNNTSIMISKIDSRPTRRGCQRRADPSC